MAVPASPRSGSATKGLPLIGRSWLDDEGRRCTVVGDAGDAYVWIEREEQATSIHVRAREQILLELALTDDEVTAEIWRR